MVASLLVGLLLVATPVQAAHHTPQWHLQHYLQCLSLLLTDPAKQSRLCGPFHYVAPPDNNHAPEGLKLPSAPPTPPQQQTCPTHEHDYVHPSAYVQYTDYILVTGNYGGGNYGGGDWNKPDDGCDTHPKGCDVAYTSSGAAPSLLLVGGCHEYPPQTCGMAWNNPEAAPSILLASQTCCVGSVTNEQQGALVLPAKIGGGPGPNFNPPQFNPPQFHPEQNNNWNGGGYCKDAWSGAPLEAPSILI